MILIETPYFCVSYALHKQIIAKILCRRCFFIKEICKHQSNFYLLFSQYFSSLFNTKLANGVKLIISLFLVKSYFGIIYVL